MAEDRKFKFEDGRFINRVSGEPIPDDEPVIIFRARDKWSVDVLTYYLACAQDDHHRQAIRDRIGEFEAWRAANASSVKEPGITHHIRLNASEVPVLRGEGPDPEDHPDAGATLEPPYPIGSKTNCKRAGWAAFFDGKPRTSPFPIDRNDLRRGFEEGWDAARAALTPEPPQ